MKMGWIVLMLAGCASQSVPTKAQIDAVAVDDAKLQDCVVRNSTREAAEKCQAEVRAQRPKEVQP